jgi:hypothetical protein
MKAGIVGVPVEELLKVARSVDGLTVLQQKGFYKITGNVAGRAVYPQNNKIVGEVHYSGFAQEPKTKIPGLMANPKFPKPTKRVSHFLDQREGLSQTQILENFRTTISQMVQAEVSAPVEFVTEEPVAVAAEQSEE